MFRITEDPSSGSLVQCLAKNYKNDSVVSVDMDVVGFMAAYSDPLCVCVVHCIWRQCLHTQWKIVPSYTVNYKPAQQVRIRCHNTDLVPCLRTRSNHFCSFYPSTVQGSLMMDLLWSETCWSTFKYFMILILSTYYTGCSRKNSPIWEANKFKTKEDTQMFSYFWKAHRMPFYINVFWTKHHSSGGLEYWYTDVASLG